MYFTPNPFAAALTAFAIASATWTAAVLHATASEARRAGS